MATVEIFLSGMTAGFAVAAPVGPLGLVCIERTLGAGWAAGLAHGCGAATVHIAFASLAIAGLGVGALERLQLNSALMPLLSGVVLLGFAARTVCRRTLGQVVAPRTSLTWSYIGALLLGTVNPMTLILFLGLAPALLAWPGASAASLAVAGVAAGSALWWFILCSSVALLRTRLSPTLIGLCNALSGLLLGTLGLAMLLQAVHRW
jgi:threonine/homoserine/homoserine lactone efflux protein